MPGAGTEVPDPDRGPDRRLNDVTKNNDFKCLVAPEAVVRRPVVRARGACMSGFETAQPPS